jgi:hypothetical protein
MNIKAQHKTNYYYEVYLDKDDTFPSFEIDEPTEDNVYEKIVDKITDWVCSTHQWDTRVTKIVLRNIHDNDVYRVQPLYVLISVNNKLKNHINEYKKNQIQDLIREYGYEQAKEFWE